MRSFAFRLTAVCSIVQLIACSSAGTQANPTPPGAPPASAAAPGATDANAEKLDSLVGPVALYPDPLLAQVLTASTFPKELVELNSWLAKNKSLKDEKL